MRRLPFLPLFLGAVFFTTNSGQAQQDLFPFPITNRGAPPQMPPTARVDPVATVAAVNTVDEAYTVLADDNVGFYAWTKAARKIISYQRVDSNNWIYGEPMEIEDFPIPDNYVALGESLRSKSNPSVSDLLVKRISVIYAPDFRPQPNTGTENIPSLVQCLALWDGKAHLDDLQKYCLLQNTIYSFISPKDARDL